MKKVIKRIVNIVIDIIVDFDSGSVGFNRYIVTNFQIIRGPQCFRRCAPQRSDRFNGRIQLIQAILFSARLQTILHMNIRKAILLLSIRISTVIPNSTLTELLRLLRMTTLPTTELRVTIRKLTRSPMKNFKSSSSIVAKYTGTKIGGVGNFLSFLRTEPGFFLCVLLPMIIFFVYEAVRVVLNLLAYNKGKNARRGKACG